MKKLIGSEKQVKWAEDIRSKVLEIATHKRCDRVVESVESIESVEVLIENYKFVTSTYKTESEKAAFIDKIDFRLSNKKDFTEHDKEEDMIQKLEKEEEVTVKTSITSRIQAQMIVRSTNENVELNYNPCYYKKEKDGTYAFAIPTTLENLLREILEK